MPLTTGMHGMISKNDLERSNNMADNQTSENKTEESLPQSDLSKIQNQVLKELIESGIITEQGIRVNGVGIIIKKLDRLIELIDKANTRLYYIEKKLEQKG